MTEADIVKAMDEAYLNTTPHGDAMRAALRIAIPWAREQALREALSIAETGYFAKKDRESAEYKLGFANGVVFYVREVSKRIKALIPARPSQADHSRDVTNMTGETPVEPKLDTRALLAKAGEALEDLVGLRNPDLARAVLAEIKEATK